MFGWEPCAVQISQRLEPGYGCYPQSITAFHILQDLMVVIQQTPCSDTAIRTLKPSPAWRKAQGWQAAEFQEA